MEAENAVKMAFINKKLRGVGGQQRARGEQDVVKLWVKLFGESV